MPGPAYDGDTPPVDESIDRMIRRVQRSTWSMLPVEVVAVDFEQGCVDVRPVVADLDADNSRVDLPVIRCAGILWPGSGGGFELTHTISEGDEGLALFASRSISDWLATGNRRRTPEGDRVGALTDAIYIAGAFPLSTPPQALEDLDAEGAGALLWRVRRSGGLTALTLAETAATLEAATEVLLGSSAATDYVALASLVAAELSKISTAIGTLAAGLGGAPIANPYPTPGAVAASKVKAT